MERNMLDPKALAEQLVTDAKALALTQQLSTGPLANAVRQLETPIEVCLAMFEKHGASEALFGWLLDAQEVVQAAKRLAAEEDLRRETV
jgi:hypothetical protein